MGTIQHYFLRKIHQSVGKLTPLGLICFYYGNSYSNNKHNSMCHTLSSKYIPAKLGTTKLATN